MKQVYRMLCLLLVLSGCNKSNKMEMIPVKGLSLSQEPISFSTIHTSLPTKRSFIASNGDKVSFAKKNDVWIAIIDKNLPKGFSRRVKLPVCFFDNFSVEKLFDYSPDEQKKIIHIQKKSLGKYMVHVGKKGGLPGGIQRQISPDGRGLEGYWKPQKIFSPPLIPRTLPTLYPRSTSTVPKLDLRCCGISLSSVLLGDHLCNKCGACLVTAICPYSCTSTCKACCGCSERIAGEKEQERKPIASAPGLFGGMFLGSVAFVNTI